MKPISEGSHLSLIVRYNGIKVKGESKWFKLEKQGASLPWIVFC